MLVNYEHYRIFYYAAKYQNITQAAAALMSSQPNVTRTIKHMEKVLGCVLFVRTARGMKLTEEGERLYEHVAVAYEHLETAEKELSDRLSLREGTVTIGTGETALHVFLLDKLTQFHTMYPKVRLKITNGSTPQSVRALESGAVDFSVVTDPGIMSAQIKSIPLCSFREILIGGSQYKYMTERPISLSELTNLPLVSLDRNTRGYQFYRDFFLSEGIELDPDIEVATSDMIMPIVENNLGVGFIPEHFARQAIAEERVFRLTLNREIPDRDICLIKDKGRSLSAAADRLQKFICSAQCL